MKRRRSHHSDIKNYPPAPTSEDPDYAAMPTTMRPPPPPPSPIWHIGSANSDRPTNHRPLVALLNPSSPSPSAMRCYSIAPPPPLAPGTLFASLPPTRPPWDAPSYGVDGMAEEEMKSATMTERRRPVFSDHDENAYFHNTSGHVEPSHPPMQHGTARVGTEKTPTPMTASTTTTRKTTVTDKKRGRMCKMDGCENYIVHKGLCCRHGGGRKCSVEGCESSAKHLGRCWKHGGSTACKMPDCTKRAKAKGLCWAHGGGTKCSHPDGCSKVAVSSGFCWAHGGGKRCIFDGCQRPALERTFSFCVKHYEQLQDVDYYEV